MSKAFAAATALIVGLVLTVIGVETIPRSPVTGRAIWEPGTPLTILTVGLSLFLLGSFLFWAFRRDIYDNAPKSCASSGNKG